MDKELWLEIRIKLNNIYEDGPKIIKRIIQSIIKDNEKIISSFYFLYESDNDFKQCIMFRMRVDKEEDRQKLKEELIKISKSLNLKQSEHFKFSEDDGSYEENNFGKESWKTVQKFFEYGNRLCLIKLDGKIEKRKDFNEGKFIHCFLNQWGNSTLDEANFHLNRCLERLIRIFGKEKAIKSLKESLEKIRKN